MESSSCPDNGKVSQEEGNRIQGFGVGPLQVIEGDQEGMFPGGRGDQLAERFTKCRLVPDCLREIISGLRKRLRHESAQGRGVIRYLRV